MTSQDCYIEEDEALAADFVYCDPSPRYDWIGIYDASDNAQQLGWPLLWTYACGTQTCMSSVETGSVGFSSGPPVVDGLESWPLGTGTYRMHLIDGESPFGSYAASVSSNEFVIEKSKCEDSKKDDEN